MADPRTGPTVADRAIRMAAAGLGGQAGPEFWLAFSAAWRARLAAIAPPEPGPAAEALRAEHEAEARPVPERVHPSWWLRALKDESPAVRRAVAIHAEPVEVRAMLRAGLGLVDADLATDRPPDPGALRQVLSLWAERIVGGPPRRADDPPVVVALTSAGGRSLYRLAHATGLAKRAIASESAGPEGEKPEGWPALGARESDWAMRVLAAEAPGFEARFIALARRDIRAVPGDDRRSLARLGLASLGRLLSAVDPHRARWTLQHLPYDVARFLRSQMGPPTPLPRALLEGEGRLLRVAADRLGLSLEPAGARP